MLAALPHVVQKLRALTARDRRRMTAILPRHSVRAVVAMSGGVDSSVAAALLASSGRRDDRRVDAAVRSARGDRGRGFRQLLHARRSRTTRDASRRRIGIPHYIMNFERQFDEQVVSNFVREYAAGRTPLPCAHCNSDLKFATLLERAPRARRRARSPPATTPASNTTRRPGGTGCAAASTRRRTSPTSSSRSTRRSCRARRFPVGALTKPEVRAHARRLGLPVAEKPDSQEICFVPDGDYASFVDAARARGGDGRRNHGPRRARARPPRRRPPLHGRTAEGASALRLGAVVRAGDRCRRRARSSSDRARRSRRRPHRVGRELDCRHRAGRRHARRRADSPSPPGRSARASTRCPARRARVQFDEPQRAVTPGQAVVFYDGDEVVGGGWIERAD